MQNGPKVRAFLEMIETDQWDDRVFALACQEDPVFFCRSVLKWNPWPLQEEILYSIRDNPRTAVQSCHASGKSSLSARAALWFLQTHPNSIVITTAPTMHQVEDIIWKEIAVAYAGSNPKIMGRLYRAPRLEIAPDWWAVGLSVDKPDAFQGIHADYVLVIFDEASGIPGAIWEAAEGILLGGYARFLAIGNPTDPTSRFYEECQGAKSTTKVFEISAYITPNFTSFGITEEDVEKGDWRKKVNAPYPYPTLVLPEAAEDTLGRYQKESMLYQARVLGRFPKSSSDALIPIGFIMEAVRRHKEFEEHPGRASIKPVPPVIIGLDVADENGDNTVRCIKAGDYVYSLKVEQEDDPMQTVGRVIQEDLSRFPDATVQIDAIGIGSPLVARFRELGKKVKKIDVRQAPTNKEMFYDLKAELYWGLRQKFLNGTIAIPDDQELKEELQAIRIVPPSDSAGKIRIISKKEMRRLLKRSPDRAEALMLAFAESKQPYIDQFIAREMLQKDNPEVIETARKNTIDWLLEATQHKKIFY